MFPLPPQTDKSFEEDCSWVKRVKNSWPRISVQRLCREMAVGNSSDVGEVSVPVWNGARGPHTTESTAFHQLPCSDSPAHPKFILSGKSSPRILVSLVSQIFLGKSESRCLLGYNLALIYAVSLGNSTDNHHSFPLPTQPWLPSLLV